MVFINQNPRKRFLVAPMRGYDESAFKADASTDCLGLENNIHYFCTILFLSAGIFKGVFMNRIYFKNKVNN